ncbi:OapC/ArvC family zinc-ribbon domain-containing protein [Halorubrum sp. DTA46]|uniref:OapC/ArvC family zinc-ribbon domain-containing protein n=1 Tax=Halorubrum sp. DTA46 TaxID=3402162 RepID=UPI003AAB105E
MPHQCTSCGRTFPDGSKEMLSGCPDCGGNKFQFQPKGSQTEVDPTSPTDDKAAPSETVDSTASETVDSTASETVDSTGSETETADSPPPESEAQTPSEQPTETPTPPEDSTADHRSDSSAKTSAQSPPSDGSEQVDDRAAEDTAQASARSDIVSPDELNRASQDIDSTAADDSSDSETQSGPRPDIGQLRDELNEQFESIRIVSPGTYELNLMELYDRQEYIISLQEDGRYVIEMPDAWGVSDE